MSVRTLLLVLVLVAIAVFAALNWPTFTEPTTLSLGFGSVVAPLGLVMLGLLVAVGVIFLAYIVYLQTSVLLETRRHARELQAHRALADQAEASRFTELRSFIESELQIRATREAELHNELLMRMDQMESTVRSTMQDANNTVASYLGELEDRLERGGHDSGGNRMLGREH